MLIHRSASGMCIWALTEQYFLTLGTCARVTVVSLCMSVPTLASTAFNYKSSMQYTWHLYDTLKVFDLWISLKCFVIEMALFAYHG